MFCRIRLGEILLKLLSENLARFSTITKVEDYPEAKKPAYKLWADFGEHGVKKSSAQITKLYTKEDLVGKQIIGVINFPAKQIGKFTSEFLTEKFE